MSESKTKLSKIYNKIKTFSIYIKHTHTPRPCTIKIQIKCYKIENKKKGNYKKNFFPLWHKYLITISNCFPTKINPKNTLEDTFCVKTKTKKKEKLTNI